MNIILAKLISIGQRRSLVEQDRIGGIWVEMLEDFWVLM